MKSELFEFYLNEINEKFSGWDFSHIRERMIMEPLPWSYQSKITKYILNSKSLLDMGTGGGEFLSKIPFPENTFATESYKPNIPVSIQRLEPLGIEVREFTVDNKLPFDDNQFDLIINRHESYDPKEVRRILKKEGYFITQQVGDQDNIEINNFLNVPIPYDEGSWNLEMAFKQLQEYNFQIIEQLEHSPITRIYDIGALIYYLKVIPWQFPDFTIEKYKNNLLKLHKRIDQEGYIDVISQRFMIISQLEK
ncbi:MAG: methyltransferase domain-containing protein [Candidatus Hodarchaeales archaeon]|jgi:SAM-dependent methyltransferase